MAYNANTHAVGFGFGQRFQALRVEWADKMAQRKTYRATYAELSALSNRELADLGMHRSNIRNVAMEAAYGK